MTIKFALVICLFCGNAWADEKSRAPVESESPAKQIDKVIAQSDGKENEADQKVLPEPSDGEVAKLNARIADLEKKIKILEASRRELLTEIATKNRIIAENVRGSQVDKGQAAAQRRDEQRAADATKPDWFWTIDARKIQIDTTTNGRISGDRFSATTTTTVQNLLQATGQFTNLSKAAYEYSFTITIRKGTNPIGSKTLRTGVLKPGETVSIAVDVPVSSIEGKWNTRIDNVLPLEK